MTIKLGYLLPTREQIMQGRPQAAPLLTLAEQAENLGYDSVWVGDSILAKPRHEPLTLLAGVAGRTKKLELGTAVLLPALRNPVVLAHMAATIDQISEGRLILGVGIANDVPSVHDEFEAVGVPFEKRVGRMLEGLRLCKALWTGEPVDWDGRWKVRQGILAPTPYRSGGPPLWGTGSTPAGLARVGRFFDGWFPVGPDAETIGQRWTMVKDAAREAGRDPADIAFAVYLTLVIDDDAARGEQRINDYLAGYYRTEAERIRRTQACFAGSETNAVEWLKSFVNIGASHLVVRFAGDHDRHLKTIAQLRSEITSG